MISTIDRKETQVAKQLKSTKLNATAITKTESLYSIFFVDDDPMVLKMLNRHFNNLGRYHTTTFATGEACLEALDQKPDIIVLDHNLTEHKVDKQGMNGLDILQKIKDQLPETQVIMLSAQVEVQVAVDCLKKGAVNYIEKDVTMQFNVENAVEAIVKSMELKEEINQLSQTIKRDKLLMRGYGVIIFLLVLGLYYFWLH